MLTEAQARGWGGTAAEVAVLLSERWLGGTDADLEARLRRWRGDRGKRAEAARGLARRWLTAAGGIKGDGGDVGACVALAYPDRLSRRRGGSGEEWLSVGGRGFRLDAASALAREEWLAVAEVSGAAGGARILSAAPVSREAVEALFADRIASGSEVRFDPASGGVRATHGRRLGAILLAGGEDSRADPAAIEAALLQGVREHGLDLLPWSGAAKGLRRRVKFARPFAPDLPDLSDAALMVRIDEWLPTSLHGKRRLGDIDPGSLGAALETLLGWDSRRLLDRLMPSHFETPAGSRHEIDYEAEAGPTVTMRVQSLFGLTDHPRIAGGAVPLILALTSPAGRPIQTTSDLPGFWRGSWHAVAKEMRGRYPRHPWPEDPASADPTLRTKRATGR
jgi:ATP-dependent helicase HrpB